MLVLVAYDGSPGADEAVAAAAELFPAVRTTVLTVWSSPRDGAGAALAALPAEVVETALEEIERVAEAAARELAEQAAARLRDAEAVTERCAVNVWSTIHHVARERQAAAIVVGSRGRTQLASVILGSVASGLVHHAQIPVVVVPRPG